MPGGDGLGGAQGPQDVVHGLLLAGRQLGGQSEGGAVHHLRRRSPAVLLGGHVHGQQEFQEQKLIP